MAPRQVVQRIADSLLILAFFAAAWSAMIAKTLHYGNSPCVHENRALAEMPDFQSTPLAQLPKKIEAYLLDHLPFRAELIKYHATFKHQYMKLRNDSIVIGKEGWLFYDLNGCQTLDYTGQAPLTDEQLEQWKTFLERRQAYLAAKNCRYLFVIAPNAASIYPEMLPSHVASNKGVTRREQLLAYLASHSSPVEVIDLVEPIRAAKPRGQVWFRADSHWSGLGFQVALESVAQRLHDWFPEVGWKPLGSDFELRDSPAPNGLWWMLGFAPTDLPREPLLARRNAPATRTVDTALPGNWQQPPAGAWWSPVGLENPAAQHSMVLLGDSFFTSGAALASERPLGDCFRRSLFTVNPCGARNAHAELESIVYQQQPDVVIEELAERYLQFAPGPASIAPPVDRPDVLTVTRQPKSIDR